MRGDLTVEADGELGGDERQPGRHMLGERLDELSRLRRAFVDSDMDARSLQRRDAAASGRGVGVERGYVHAAHAGLDESLGAGRRAPPVGARLERDIEVGALGGGARLPERHDLGVGLPGRLRGALADDASVLHEHRADRGVRVRAAHCGARQLDRSTHVRHFGHATPPSSSQRRTRTSLTHWIHSATQPGPKDPSPRFRSLRSRLHLWLRLSRVRAVTYEFRDYAGAEGNHRPTLSRTAGARVSVPLGGCPTPRRQKA